MGRAARRNPGTLSSLSLICAATLLGCDSTQRGAAPDGAPQPSAGRPGAGGPQETQFEPAAAAAHGPRFVQLGILYVQVPADQQPVGATAWNHLDENRLDSGTALRLARNGIRVGVGHTRFWPAIQAALDAVEGLRVAQSDPLSVPPGLPLLLELDDEPRDQTIFHVGDDGVLSGGDWPQSRNVLRILWGPDAGAADRIRVDVVPEVHRGRTGWEFIRTEAGLWRVPRDEAESFESASCSLSLEPQEFVLIAPDVRANLEGLIGDALLCRDLDGKRFLSYVFLQPAAPAVGGGES